ncbi:MAG: hypothetical protein P8M11_02275, partial [Planctomycetota bacterium]|nr:hypothetical protein [Planctomycetota bacterium]
MAAPPSINQHAHRLSHPMGEALGRFFASGMPFKRRLETLVFDLPAGESDELMMLMKESRGAWAMLLGR